MKLLYFAWVREKTGTAGEDMTLPPGVTTVAGLVEVLAAKGGGYDDAFGDTGAVRAAVNRNHVDMTHPVNNGDEVAFFPPVTGGRNGF